MNNRKAYRKIAKENGVTVVEVKRGIQSALEYAYNNSNNNNMIKAYQDQVPRKGDVPTPDEFIKFAVEKVKNET